MSTILSLASGVASLCTIAVTFLTIFKKILPFGIADRTEKKLLEDVHSLRRAEETLRESNVRFENDSIHEATQKEVRERLILYLAQKEYPRDQRRTYELSAWFGFVFTIFFWVLLILPMFSKNNSEFYFSWLIFICSALSWGLMSSCLGYLAVENKCLADYMEQLRISSSPLAPRRPGDKHSEAKEIDKNVYDKTFFTCSSMFAFLLLILLIVFNLSVSQFELLNFNQWLEILIFFVFWLVGSAAVTGLFRMVDDAKFRSHIFSRLRRPQAKFKTSSFLKRNSEKGEKNES